MEQQLGRIAAINHGVVTRRDLLQAGVTEAEITHRLGTGALLREYRGVYRVGHRAPSVEARYLAAVRACGEGAVLSGRAAAHLLGLLKGSPPAPEVTTLWSHRVPGVRSRRSRYIDATIARGIPVTTVPSTLVDLAARLEPDELARAFHQAEVRYRTTPAQVEAVLARRPRAPGAGTLRRVLRGDEPVILSELERRFRRVLERAGLPVPRTTRQAGAHWVDCRWPECRLTVELDSYRFHHSRYAWEEDRRREREARGRGDDFRRYTWRDVAEDPRLMLGELRGLLG